MRDIENTKKEAPIKEAPMLGLTGLGGGVASLMWHHAGEENQIGQLWAWGDNQYGCLGLNQSPNVRKSSPTQVGTDTNWKVVIDAGNAGEAISFAIKDDGTGWAAGLGGLMGINQPGFPPTSINHSSPVQLAGTWSDAWARSAQGNVVATKADGTLWTWGSNQHGMLGLNQAYGPGEKKNRSSPCQVGTDTDWALHDGGVSCGYEYMFAMKQNGTLWMWGKNDNAGMGVGQPFNYRRSSPTQLGTETTWEYIVSGSQGGNSVAKKTDGSLWVWGGSGGLGIPGSPPKNSPVQLGTGTDWAGATVGGTAAFVTKTDGSLWVWGNANYGKLGLNGPNNQNMSSPMQIPGTWKMNNNSFAQINYATLVIKQDGTLWSWGNNNKGQLGLNQPTNDDRSSPAQVGTATNWLAVGGISAPGKNFFGIRK